jgi:glycosyltransferase involved in cell wall biosynthesis
MNDSPMKILVLNHEYPPIGGGGGQACLHIVEELAKRGDEITVITAHFRDHPREERSGNMRIIRVPSLRRQPFRIGFTGMGVYIISAILAGLKVIRLWKPELIHVHFAVPAGVSALILHYLTRTPYLLTSHLGDVPGGVPEKTSGWFRLVFPFTKPVWRKAARIVAVSSFTASLVQEHYHVLPKIIPNGIDLSAISHEIHTHNPPRIVFAGRFMPQKNLLTFIDVLESVRDLDWTCSMLGDGPLFPEVVDKIKAIGLSDRVTLPGWVSTETIISLFKESDILLMPSLSEGLSVVGVQALMAGLAIVANNVGGFADLVETDHNGILAELGDTQTLKDGLRKYLSSPHLLQQARMASLGIARKFDITNVVDQYKILFSDILNGG